MSNSPSENAPPNGAQPAPVPPNEQARMGALEDYRILDTLEEQAFDDLTKIASHICDTPIALVSLVDRNRQWFKSRVGLDATETSRDVAFCSHAILGDDVFSVPDALQDHRFQNNPLVQGDPNIRFYAGAPLQTPGGFRVGTLCVIDRKARDLSNDQREALRALSRQAIALMELRKSARVALEQKHALEAQSMELQRSNADLEQFAYVASHDLQEPIRMMGAYAELLQKEYGATFQESGRGSTYVKYVMEGANRMHGLVESLLRFAQIDNKENAIANVEASQSLQGALDNLSVYISKNHADIQHDVLPRVSANPTYLTQIFQNLINNGIKFCKEATPRIRVTATEENSTHWRLSVHDNGIGIQQEYQDQIFGVFKRLNPRTEFTGSGIGLATVEKMVRHNRGKIWVESTPGVGTTFHFTVPRATVS